MRSCKQLSFFSFFSFVCLLILFVFLVSFSFFHFSHFLYYFSFVIVDVSVVCFWEGVSLHQCFGFGLFGRIIVIGRSLREPFGGYVLGLDLRDGYIWGNGSCYGKDIGGKVVLFRRIVIGGCL